MFLVDDSSSIREIEWPRLRRFLQQVTDRFTVSATDTRIGIVRYASTAMVIYRLSSPQTRFAVRDTIGRMEHLGGSTNLAAAMRLAYQQVFLAAPRPGAARVG